MEKIIVIVGFLGAGKTTLLRRLLQDYSLENWDPFVILNDYENARLDSMRLMDIMQSNQVQPLNGSCICCSGIAELRNAVNAIPEREKGITLIEANGTSDACSLMEFLGVGLKENFLPPIQISVVDVANWGKRGIHNELEANQVQVSSLIVLNHLEKVEESRFLEVKHQIRQLNPGARIENWQNLDSMILTELKPSSNQHDKMDHLKAHWSSCSVDLPDPMSSKQLQQMLQALPKSILRVKGCTRLDRDSHYSFFEKTPTCKDATVRPFHGKLVSGPKLVTVGPGSDPAKIEELLLTERV